jgi:hypothetical protein
VLVVLLLTQAEQHFLVVYLQVGAVTVLLELAVLVL